MGFFTHEPTDALNPDHAVSGESPAAGEWFRQEEKPHISLSDYISKHLNTTEQGAVAEPGPSPGSFPLPVSGTRTERPLTGMFLNSIDGDLTAGLENYLPTPIFRLRVMRKRLHDEIQALRQRLNKYERLPEKSPDMQARMALLRERLQTLEHHEAQVGQELSAALTFGPLFERGFQGYNRLTSFLEGISTWLAQGGSWLLYGDRYQLFQESGQELRDLQAVFSERLQDPSVSDAEISQLFNRYEQVLANMETAALGLKPAPFLQRLWHRAAGLVK